MSVDEFVLLLDRWGRSRTPFFFLVDFELQKPLAFPLNSVPNTIQFEFNGVGSMSPAVLAGEVKLEVEPIAPEHFQKKFEEVHKHLNYGDSYLVNLTVRNAVAAKHTLADLFNLAKAKYKLLYQDQFLVFSPETFIQIRDGKIFAFPMKGTIDASVHDAEKQILNNQKELAEHVTIVDLLRNDLSLVATNVTVSRFRYIDRIVSNRKTLLQVSSEITGNLLPEYEQAYGSILKKLLPAGSISGAPKKKTVEIIQQAEGESRGYYTGIAGIFDGNSFDSGVLIRFLENRDGKLFYRSGGGITAASDWESEYHEVIDKIYVPLN